MTNETTASQPKSTPQEKIPQESIGDDAHFHELFNTGAGFDEIAAYIDNFRAPAAQASATIQAAPEGFRLVAIEPKPKTCHGDGFNSCCSEACAWKADQAATIQEPVMVAEPVGANIVLNTNAVTAAVEAWRESTNHPMGGMIDRIDIGNAITVYLAYTNAAPMVADPAGVATFQWRAFGEQDWIDFTSTEEKLFSGPVWVRLAATVKAVPSEAMDGVLFRWLNEDHDSAEVREQARALAKRLGTSSYFAITRDIDAAMQIAAPLADKTGGGE